MARDLRGECELDLAGALLFNGSMLLHLLQPDAWPAHAAQPVGPTVRAPDDRESPFARSSRASSPSGIHSAPRRPLTSGR